MIPVGDSPATFRTPIVNILLIVTCIAVFLFEVSLGPSAELLVRRFGVIPLWVARALAGDPRVPPVVLVTLVTSQFLHGGWLHLGGNMLFLWVFGDNVEDRLGHLRYLAFYLLAGTGAALVQVAVDPASRVPLIGASGAIAGVLGAYLLFQPLARITVLVPIFLILWPIRVPAVLMLGVWFLTQFGSGLAAITEAGQGGIAWWAHVGGFLAGLTLAILFPKAQPRTARRSALTMVEAPVPLRLRRQPPGCILGTLSVASDAVQLLLTFRLVAHLFGVGAIPLAAPAVLLLDLLSWPLVKPFVALLPALSIGFLTLELYTILALIVYQVLAGLLIRLLTGFTSGGYRPVERRG
ncbi:MAG: rhomboid family intramembrane serine protease [Chloroflexi bacterium]|nr:rhomboid family intramembrane serine protease [Chloroflexota bacterium]